MSAPEIPNLLSLRTTGPRLRGGGGRNRGSGISQRGGHHGLTSRRAQSDLDVQATDSDAAVSRLSAVSLGYLEDPFAGFFVNGVGARRMPVINRGTYVRTSALDILINAFLSSCEGTKQIISLGAGTDTRYFRLRAKQKHRNLVYHEFDFPDVAQLKYATVSKKQELAHGGGEGQEEILFKNPVSEASPMGGDPEWGFTRDINGEQEVGYCFHPMDLRKLPYGPGRTLSTFKALRGDVPTLIISECCLCYLEIETTRDIIKFFTDQIPSLGIIIYEPIGVDDAFGQTMVANLAARNIIMPTVREYKDLADQKRRLVELGFGEKKEEGKGGGSEAVDVEMVWNEWIPSEEKKRVDRLEGLDEVEEWQVIARHYSVVWGWKGKGWDAWEGLKRS